MAFHWKNSWVSLLKFQIPFPRLKHTSASPLAARGERARRLTQAPSPSPEGLALAFSRELTAREVPARSGRSPLSDVQACPEHPPKLGQQRGSRIGSCQNARGLRRPAVLPSTGFICGDTETLGSAAGALLGSLIRALLGQALATAAAGRTRVGSGRPSIRVLSLKRDPRPPRFPACPAPGFISQPWADPERPLETSAELRAGAPASVLLRARPRRGSETRHSAATPWHTLSEEAANA